MERQISYLLQQYFNGGTTLDEEKELFRLLRTATDDHELDAFIAEAWQSYEPGAEMPAAIDAQIRQALFPQQAPVRRIHFPRKWLWAAASLILLAGAGGYFWMVHKNRTDVQAPAVAQPNTDIAPGREGAVLTLADGSRLVLDSLGNGTIATQNGAQVMLEGGQLVYDATTAVPDEVAYNTISTPKGRQFRVILLDGTKVWLNAGSALHYPTAFAGKARQVAITGEAYFEVASRPLPFRVTINGQTTIEVLGTWFNVNAYANEEEIRTTLLNGAVRVNSHDRSIALQPGQQAAIKKDGSLAKNDQVNIARVMAWKNGLFDFEGADLKEVMNQLERWYDIEVIYEKEVPAIYFGGKMSRNVPLSDVLLGLKESDVHLKLEGRKLIVKP